MGEYPQGSVRLEGVRRWGASCRAMADLVKQALIVGVILGAVKFLLGRFGGPWAKFAGYLG